MPEHTRLHSPPPAPLWYGVAPCDAVAGQLAMSQRLRRAASHALLLSAVVCAAMAVAHLAPWASLFSVARARLPPGKSLAVGWGPTVSNTRRAAAPMRVNVEDSKEIEIRQSLRLVKNALPTVPTADTPLKRFGLWSLRSNIITNGIGIADFDGMRGVVAVQDISAGTVLASVPLDSLLMSPEGPEASPFRSIPGGWWLEADASTRLAIKLVAESQKGSRSKLWGWVDVLPRKPFTPMFWTSAELEALQYPPIVAAIQQQRREWRTSFEQMRTLCPSMKITWKEFAWAMGIVRSRAVAGRMPVDGPKRFETYWCLVPWVDMVNARYTSRMEVRSSVYATHMELHAGENVAKGQQVFLPYGHDNDDLLQHYGFVEADNPQDGFCITGVLEAL
eukprot:EG_transcript_15427